MTSAYTFPQPPFPSPLSSHSFFNATFDSPSPSLLTFSFSPFPSSQTSLPTNPWDVFNAHSTNAAAISASSSSPFLPPPLPPPASFAYTMPFERGEAAGISYLYTDAEGGGGGGGGQQQQQGGEGGGRSELDDGSEEDDEEHAPAPAASTSKAARGGGGGAGKSNTIKKSTGGGGKRKKISHDESDDDGEDGANGGGSVAGSAGSGEGRGTTLAEVLSEQGLTKANYDGLPSAKKRQLRNKVSARAFRARRKDYIETLEGQLADKDKKIEEQKSELWRIKTENQMLRTRLRHTNDH